uniref:Retinol dehydrogenase 13-like n=1 Tax=Diabrotica virgifera virgifera TaxID=50390 RepID=A0A6P7FKG3_DIAVI
MPVSDVFGWLVLLTICAVIFFNIWFKYTCMKCNSNVCLVGKTAVVTGGSLGIGHEVVLSLLSRGCRVIIVDRVITEDIEKSIISETKSSNFIFDYVDFASFKSVRDFAEKLKKTEEKIDILINNVGIGKCDGTLTEDGLNKVMQVNYYSPFLLTHLLIDLLKKSEEPKILFTASILSFSHQLFVDHVTDDNIILPDKLTSYCTSKFCTVVASDIFAKKLRKHNIKCNSYHPGAVKTNIFNEARKYMTSNILDVVATIFGDFVLFVSGQTPKDASQTAVNIVVSEEYQNVTGEFIGVFFPSLKPRGSHDKVFCKKIWKVSEKLVKLEPDEKL